MLPSTNYTMQLLSGYLVDYSTRIVSTGGSTSFRAQGSLAYYASSQTCILWSWYYCTLYSPLAAPIFSGMSNVENGEILTKNTSALPAYYNLDRYIQLDIMTANTTNWTFTLMMLTIPQL